MAGEVPKPAGKELAVALKPIFAGDPPSKEFFLRLLVLGFSGIGKSCAVVSTSPKPVYVINCDQEESLEPVKDFDQSFMSNFIQSTAEMNQALALATQMARKGEVKTVVWDTMSGFSPFLEAECLEHTKSSTGEELTMRASPLYRKYLRSFVQRLFKLPCHVVVCSHYLDVSSSEDDFGGADKKKEGGIPKVAKKGGVVGIIPMLWGAARAEIPALFQDKVFMEKMGSDDRVFVTGINGVYGPGCRSMPGNHALPANVSSFIKRAEAARAQRSAGVMAMKKVAPATPINGVKPAIIKQAPPTVKA